MRCCVYRLIVVPPVSATSICVIHAAGAIAIVVVAAFDAEIAVLILAIAP
jgi:hypothetical protein